SVAGTPDNYFLVTNALTLKERLTKAFNDIEQANSSVTSPAVVPVVNSSGQDSSRSVYRTSYNIKTWSGDVIKESTDPNQSSWEASKMLPSAGDRVIKMADGGGDDLVDFTWDN